MGVHLNDMVSTMADGTNTVPSLAASTVTNDTYLQETGLSTEGRGKKIGRNIFQWTIPG